MGPMPYGITWRLMLLKVSHKPPRPIEIFIPKSQREKGMIINNVVNNEIIAELKHGGFTRIQCLMGLHGS
jgi:hypothetical protein